MKRLTPRQREVFSYIQAYMENHRYAPSVRDIAAHFAITPMGAYDHLGALERKECIRRTPRNARSIEILSEESEPPSSYEREEFLQIPLLGRVQAGSPILAEENLEEYLKLPQDDMKPGKYFALKVEGDSMKDVGILEGDLAVLLVKDTATNGDIVVARLNGEKVVLKRFYKETNRIKLKSENPAYSPIYSQDVRILGKLSRIIRKYE